MRLGGREGGGAPGLPLPCGILRAGRAAGSARCSRGVCPVFLGVFPGVPRVFFQYSHHHPELLPPAPLLFGMSGCPLARPWLGIAVPIPGNTMDRGPRGCEGRAVVLLAAGCSGMLPGARPCCPCVPCIPAGSRDAPGLLLWKGGGAMAAKWE